MKSPLLTLRKIKRGGMQKINAESCIWRQLVSGKPICQNSSDGFILCDHGFCSAYAGLETHAMCWILNCLFSYMQKH